MVVEGLHVQIGAEPLPALQLLLGPGPAADKMWGWGHMGTMGIAWRSTKMLWTPHIRGHSCSPFKSPKTPPARRMEMDGMCWKMDEFKTPNLFAGPVFKARMTLAEIIPPALTPSLRIMIGVQTAQDHLAASHPGRSWIGYSLKFE